MAIFGAEASAEASADSVHFWAASALLPKQGKRVKNRIFSASAEASGHPYSRVFLFLDTKEASTRTQVQPSPTSRTTGTDRPLSEQPTSGMGRFFGELRWTMETDATMSTYDEAHAT